MTPSSLCCNALLTAHPETPNGSVDKIEARVSKGESALLKILYVLTADSSHVRIPSPTVPHRTDGLWKHTCFEAFIGAKNDAEYYEFNFSPSGEWAAYEYRDYRDGGLIEDDRLEPTISVHRTADTLELNTEICLDRLPGLQLDVGLWLGLSAVIEDNDRRLSYWALKHPPGKPDFHHPDCFAFELPFSGRKT